MPELDISRFKFLIVEDNPFMRTILNELLRSYNVRGIKAAPDGASAFKELRTFKPDVIILDWEMQPLGGIDFAQLVRTGEDSPDKFVPIIIVSGHSEENKIRQARDVGINEFLVKPISAKTLFARIRSIVEAPRPFVDSKNFFGPDRRRHNNQIYSGPERRKDTDDTDDTFVANSKN